MICDKCGGMLEAVVDSRPRVLRLQDTALHVVMRRRLCSECGERGTTYEVSAAQLERLALGQSPRQVVRALVLKLMEEAFKETEKKT